VPKLSAVIPDDVATALKARAQREDRSVGAVIRIAVAEHVGLRQSQATPVPTPIEAHGADGAAR